MTFTYYKALFLNSQRTCKEVGKTSFYFVLTERATTGNTFKTKTTKNIKELQSIHLFQSDPIHTVTFFSNYVTVYLRTRLSCNPINMILALEPIRIELILQVQLQTQSFSDSCRTVQARTRNTFAVGNLSSIE